MRRHPRHRRVTGGQAVWSTVTAVPAPGRSGDEDRLPRAARAGAALACLFHTLDAQGRQITVHRADCGPLREAARELVRLAYSGRGYRVAVDGDATDQVTLAVCEAGVVVATATVGLDGLAGLKADLVHKACIDGYRLQGARVCEITGLAAARGAAPTVVMPVLFRQLFLLTSVVHRCTDIFIEVHPRHRRFYESAFGFQCLSPMCTSPRVNAPAHLLRLSIEGPAPP
jgi:hypothetical protein